MDYKYAEATVTVDREWGVLRFTPLPGGLVRDGKRVMRPITMREYRIGVEGTVNVRGVLGDIRVTGDVTMLVRGFFADIWLSKDPDIQFFRESGAQIMYTPGSNRWANIMTVTRTALCMYEGACPDWKDRALCVTLTHEIQEMSDLVSSLEGERDRANRVLGTLYDRRTFI